MIFSHCHVWSKLNLYVVLYEYLIYTSTYFLTDLFLYCRHIKYYHTVISHLFHVLFILCCLLNYITNYPLKSEKMKTWPARFVLNFFNLFEISVNFSHINLPYIFKGFVMTLLSFHSYFSNMFKWPHVKYSCTKPKVYL